MDKFVIWNVRGINNSHKQLDIKKFISMNKVGLVGLLETKVKAHNMGRLYQRVFVGWCFRCFSSNSSFHSRGKIVVS